ncbi:putative pentatricopeptide repeat-containing protein At1g02420 [Phoenix dactylifera]|uniref:Pentatricopeptide repeat-containing protein At1g02420 n=1 Tax=Phoenix dactylifera TaxID=42345 RepID=A0A8B7BXC1_PHODC|nr:putative pentatricopeptide repeat-containing protein At1g02420 [Phoenix dactylifera]
MLFKRFPIQSPLIRNAPPHLQFNPQNSILPSLRNPFSTETLAEEEQDHHDSVGTVFHIITTSSSHNSMIQSLKSSGIFLSNDLIDRVLKRFRFSHGNSFRALEFFEFVGKRKGFYHTPFSYDTMLYILGRSRRFEEVWRLLVEMKRKDRSLITTRTVQIVLGRIAKVCSVRQTVESFRGFRKLCVDFNTNCLNALLRTLCQEKSMADARNVYHRLKHEFRPDLQTFNILLSGWKSVEDAEGFFEEMIQLGVKPDLVTYNCLVDVYCKNCQVEKAHKLIDKMRDEEIYPDVITYTSLIGGLGLIGQPDKARDVLKDMRELGCYPDVAAYNAAIRNYCIAKRLGNAFALLEEIAGRGLAPNATSYNLFFRCFYWANDLESAWRLYERMRSEGCLPNTQSCMFLVRLFRRQEKVAMALQLWNDMVEKGFGSFTLVSDVLFDLLCDSGKLDDAERCFLQMVEKGQKPSTVAFRRIKVLMRLANRHDSLRNLSEKMAMFGHLSPVDTERVDDSSEIPSSILHPC